VATKAEKQKCGIEAGITNLAYHEGMGWSSSQVKTMAEKTPLHFYDKYLADDREEMATDIYGKFAIGSLFHSMVLEPEKKIAEEFLVVEEINRRSKAGKENFVKDMEEALGTKRYMVTKAEVEDCKKMTEQARKQPLFNSLFTGGSAELSVYWIDPDTELLCKCRPDYLHKDNIIVDLKSCIDASQDGAGKASFNFGYYISAAFYLDGVAAATGKDTDSFIFAFMEKVRPFACAPYVIQPEDIALGRAMYKAALQRIKDCIRAERWPGYSTEITELEVPGWARKQIRAKLGK
jgi:hypothetical protein